MREKYGALLKEWHDIQREQCKASEAMREDYALMCECVEHDIALARVEGDEFFRRVIPRCHSSVGFHGWFDKSWDAGYCHGDTLVSYLIQVANGRYYVGPADGDMMLKSAEEVGLIVRSNRPLPTPSQLAVAGLSYSQSGYDEHVHSMGTHYGWSPNYGSDNALLFRWITSGGKVTDRP